MTTQTTHRRARLFGSLGLALSAFLSPSGKIISSAVAATALVGGLATILRPPTPPTVQTSAPRPVAPMRLVRGGSSAPVFAYIDVGGHTLPVMLAEGTTGDSLSVGHGSASGSPFLELSGGDGRIPATGSPRSGPHDGAPALPSRRAGAHAPLASQPGGNPMVSNFSPSTGPRPPATHSASLDAPQTTGTPSGAPAAVAAPDSGSPKASLPKTSDGLTHPADRNNPAGHYDPSDAGAPTAPQGAPVNDPHQFSHDSVPDLSETPASHFPPGIQAAGRTTPPQDDPLLELLVPSPDDLRDLSAAPESQFPPETEESHNPPIQFTLTPDADQSPSQTEEISRAAAVPEPSMIGLMLLGLGALACRGRRRLTPAQRV